VNYQKLLSLHQYTTGQSGTVKYLKSLANNDFSSAADRSTDGVVVVVIRSRHGLQKT